MAFYPSKNILHRCLSGKKFLAPKVWRKKSYPNQITQYPDSKVNWSAHYPRDDVKQTNKNKPRSSSKQINP